MRISDWSSDVCSSDLEQATTSTNRDGVRRRIARRVGAASPVPDGVETYAIVRTQASKRFRGAGLGHLVARSEEHTSELQSLMRISYAVFCLQKNNNHKRHTIADRHMIT